MKWRVFFLLGIAMILTLPLVACGAMQRMAMPLAEGAAPAALFRLPARQDETFVVLTIDDAPSSRTDEILALLSTYGATATFFVHTDQMTPDRRDVLQAAVAQGHEIANHLPADRPAWRLSAEDFATEFARADDALVPFGEGKAPYFRPPHGLYRVAHMDGPLEVRGYRSPLAGSDRRYIMASFVPWDASGDKTNTDDPALNARRARRYADQLADNLYPGAIVVFHDGEAEGRAARLAATLVSLEAFLVSARAAGYDVVSLSEGAGRLSRPE